MKLEDQVCSLELAKQLKELGVKQESIWYWHKYQDRDWEATLAESDLSAFTVAELGEMLPEFVGSWREHDNFWHCDNSELGENRRVWLTFNADTEADARAKMLIYLIENKLIKIPV